jgi:peptidyl-prolyl cis-trans isomerase C
MPSTRPFARFTVALALAANFAVPIIPAGAEDGDPVVAHANGVDIRQSDLAIAEDKVGDSMSQMGPDQRREYLIAYIADVIVLSQAAQQQKIDDRLAVRHRIEFERNEVLMETLLRDTGHAAINDGSLHAVYEESIKQLPSEQEVRARHILVNTEEEAKAIEAELKKGADFAKLSKERSKDPTAAQGGDLGYFTKDQVPPEIADVAFKLDKGQISDPVKTQYGWHIIEVEDKRTRPIPTFDEARPQLEEYVARRAEADLVQKLRAAAKIEINRPSSSAAHPAKPTKNR